MIIFHIFFAPSLQQDGSFQPDKTLTRAEMAAVITRLMDYLIQQPNQ